MVIAPPTSTFWPRPSTQKKKRPAVVFSSGVRSPMSGALGFWVGDNEESGINKRRKHRIWEELAITGLNTGWWFQTFFHKRWDNPSHWLIFFKMVKTTNQNNLQILKMIPKTMDWTRQFSCDLHGEWDSKCVKLWLNFFCTAELTELSLGGWELVQLGRGYNKYVRLVLEHLGKPPIRSVSGLSCRKSSGRNHWSSVRLAARRKEANHWLRCVGVYFDMLFFKRCWDVSLPILQFGNSRGEGQNGPRT